MASFPYKVDSASNFVTSFFTSQKQRLCSIFDLSSLFLFLDITASMRTRALWTQITPNPSVRGVECPMISKEPLCMRIEVNEFACLHAIVCGAKGGRVWIRAGATLDVASCIV